MSRTLLSTQLNFEIQKSGTMISQEIMELALQTDTFMLVFVPQNDNAKTMIFENSRNDINLERCYYIKL